MKKKNKKSKQRLQYITEGRKAATGDRAIFGGGRTDGRTQCNFPYFFLHEKRSGIFFSVCTICEKTRGARMIEPKLMVWLSHKRKEGSNKRAMMLLSSRAEKTDKNSIVHPFAPRCFSGIGNKCKDGDNNDNSCCSLCSAPPSPQCWYTSSTHCCLSLLWHCLAPPPPPIPQKNHHPFPSTFSLPLRPTYIFAFVPVSASFRPLQNLPDQCTCVRACVGRPQQQQQQQPLLRTCTEVAWLEPKETICVSALLRPVPPPPLSLMAVAATELHKARDSPTSQYPTEVFQ